MLICLDIPRSDLRFSLEIPCLYPWEQRSYAPWRIHQPPDSGENIHWFKQATSQHFRLHLSSTSALSSHYLHYSRSIYIVSTSNILISIEYFHHFVFWCLLKTSNISFYTFSCNPVLSDWGRGDIFSCYSAQTNTMNGLYSNWVLVVDFDWKIHWWITHSPHPLN